MSEFSKVVTKNIGTFHHDILCIESKWILNLVAHLQYASKITSKVKKNKLSVSCLQLENRNFILDGITRQIGLSLFSDDFFNNSYKIKNKNVTTSKFKCHTKYLINNIFKPCSVTPEVNLLNPNSAALGFFKNQRYTILNGLTLYPIFHKKNRIITNICQELIQICEPLMKLCELNSCVEKFAYKILEARFRNCVSIYTSIEKKLPPIDQIFTGTGGNITSRVVHRVIKKRGGQASVFPHGGGIGRYIKSSYIASELSTAGEYFTYNTKDKEGFEKLTKSFPGIQASFPKFTPIGHDVDSFAAFHLSCKKSAKSSAKNILYVPDAYHGEETTPYVLPDLVRLEWEMYLFSIINPRFNLFYKRHPKGFASRKHLPHLCNSSFFNSCPLRDALRNVDVVICDTTAATAFHESVCSDVGIVFIKNNIVEWRKDAYDAANKRVVFLDSYFDEKGRMRVCQSSLNEAISLSLNRKDNEFMENFIFPDKI